MDTNRIDPSELMQNALLVKNLNSLTRPLADEQLQDKLTIHFQKSNQGGDVKEVIYPLQHDRDSAIVIFGNAKDMKSALQHKHVFINEHPLTVSTLPPVFTSIKAEMDPLYFKMMPVDMHGDFQARFQQLANVTVDKNYGRISCLLPSQLECVEKEVLHLVLNGKEDPSLGANGNEIEAAAASGVDRKAEWLMERGDGGGLNENLKRAFQESYDHKNGVENSSDEQEIFEVCPEERQNVSDTSTLDKPGTKLWSPVPYKDKASGKVADDQHTVQDNSVIVDMHIYEFIDTFEKESLQKILKDRKVKIKSTSDKSANNEKKFTFTPTSNSRAGDVAEVRDKFITLFQKVSNDVSRKMIDCSSATKAEIKEATKKILSDFKADTVVCKVDGYSNNCLILRRGDVDEVARKFREYAGIRSGKSLRSRAPDVQKTLAPKTDVPQSLGLYYQNTLSRQGLEQADGAFSFVTNEGISIVVRQGDITKQSVQALVSPTDTHLTSNGGVAKAVFAAAGRELDKRCWDIKDSCWPNQPLQMTKCIVTSGFKLSCLIIHACGPAWDNSSSWYQSQLYATLTNCFHLAKESKVQTLAIPLIGSGSSSAPKNVCADVLVNAVVDYSLNSRGNTILNKLLLVNIDRESTEAIKKSFASMRANAAASYNMPKTHSNMSEESMMRQEHPLSDDRDGNKVKQPHQRQDRSTLAQRQYQGSGPNDLSTSVHTDGRNVPGTALSALGARPTGSAASGATPTSSAASSTTHTSYDAFGATFTSSASGTTPTRFASGAMPISSAPGTTPTSSAPGGTTSTGAAAPRAPPTGPNQDTDRDSSCPICLADVLTDEVVLKCKHRFCKGCFNKAMETSYKCPICQAVCGEPKGDQPPGTMKVSTSRHLHLEGYLNDGVITITYDIHSGRQTAFHPNPGKYFSGAFRTAYLPDNNEGREVLRLLEKAFGARLVFTIGSSVTTGVENKVTWNDIHHKTSMSGGPTRFGYPDPDYLKRVKEELKVKGIE